MAGIEKVRDDLYYAELERTSNPDLARQWADSMVTLVQNGLKYRRAQPGRALRQHWRDWWGAYVALGIVAATVWSGITFIHPKSHWAGLAKEDVAWEAKDHVVSWYKRVGPDGDSKVFRDALVLEQISAVKRGPVQYWRVRFHDPVYHRNVCVIERSGDEAYVTKC